MTIEQYEQLDWSPATWVFLQMGMVLFTVAVICLYAWLVYRADDAAARVGAVEPERALELEAASDAPAVEAAVETATPESAGLPSVEAELTRV